MQFTTPTTKAQLYATLQEIFHYYRIEKQEYTAVILDPLYLDRITYSELSDTQLRAVAEDMVLPELTEKYNQKVGEIDLKIAELTQKETKLGLETERRKQALSDEYDEAIIKMEKESIKKGIANSNIVLEKIAEMEEKKSDKLDLIDAELADKISDIDAEITALNGKKTNLATENTALIALYKEKKFHELKDKQEQTSREVFKYNSSMDEKEIKYNNTIAQFNANMQLKYMDINATGFTKDQLIDMGYYEDVIACVCAYYDTFSPIEAYRNVVAEHKLAVYLEDYYQDVVYLYQVRAEM